MDNIDKAVVDALYPQLKNTRNSKLRAESIRRAHKFVAALAGAGFAIVPRTVLPAQDQPNAADCEHPGTGDGR